MKLSLIASASALTVSDIKVARDVDEIDERSWTQLQWVFRNYDSNFDVQKFFTYGCYCHYNGKIDRISFFVQKCLKLLLTKN